LGEDSSKRNPDREGRILDAAARLTLRFGYDKTTVSEIAEEARISKGAVYLHFKSKEALFETLVLRESEALVDDIMQRFASDTQPFNLFTLFVQAITALLANPVLAYFVREERHFLEGMMQRMGNTGLILENQTMATMMMQRFQQAGLLRPDVDPAEVAYVIGVIRYGLLTVNNVIPPEQAPPLERVGALLGDILNRGLSTGQPADEAQLKAGLMQVVESWRTLVRRWREGLYDDTGRDS
jgi:AcrR family transcriptional regulator